MKWKTNAAFVVQGRWQWHTWTHDEPNSHAAILAKARDLGATGHDFGQATHYPLSEYPLSR